MQERLQVCRRPLLVDLFSPQIGISLAENGLNVVLLKKVWKLVMSDPGAEYWDEPAICAGEIPDLYRQKFTTLPQGYRITHLKPTFKQQLQEVANKDVETLVVKDAEYGSSWKKRGGIGAFMMLARKWDRLETQMTVDVRDATKENWYIDNYDIFERIENVEPKSGESLLETIRDLRRYLLLVETEINARYKIDKQYGGAPSPKVDTLK